MKVSIFIRTYHKDIKWLSYCLKSIHRNLEGWDEIIICIPKGQEHLLSHLTAEKVVVSPIYKNDYLGQQISKIHAYKHCSGDIIMYVDSDVVFKKGAKVSHYLHDNKPVILKQSYGSVGDAICWKQPTEKLFNEPIEHEFMRRSPQLFLKDTVRRFNDKFKGIEWYIQGEKSFSEFNALGYFAYKHEPENYVFVDIDNDLPPYNPCKQFWSWSGLTLEDKVELEKIVNH